MKKRKINEATFLPVVEWIRQLGRESQAFEVAAVAGEGRSKEDGNWDYIITIATAPEKRRINLFVETRSQLSPQLAIAAFQKLTLVPPDGIPVLCAPYVSPRVAELCGDQKVGYIDGAGNCRLAAPGLFISVSGRPNLRPTAKATIDPFSRKSSRIVRTLLTHPAQGWQVQQLAEEAGVSLGLASKVKKTLLEEAYVEERQKLLYPCDPARLLNDWAKEYRPHVKPLQLFSLTRPHDTERRIGSWCHSNGVSYALTQLAGAWRYSPMVRYDKCVVYVDMKVELQEDLPEFLAYIDAKKVDTGSNCTLWLTDDSSVFYGSREIDEISIVSPLQLYLDLKQLSGRGEEAANELAARELQEVFISTSQRRR